MMDLQMLPDDQSTAIPNCQSEFIFFDGAQELLGKARIAQILGAEPALIDPGSNSVTIGKISGVLRSLEQVYGTPGGRGLAFRIGRASFKYALQQMGPGAALRGVHFRLLPAGRRLEVGLSYLAQDVSERWHTSVAVSTHDTYWLVRADGCPACREAVASEPCCHAFAGLLHEFMSWAGGGRYYQVVETACRASGGLACEFRIDKKPLD